jgi:acyl-coenzyme A synthetase/AMP-(fatty) acid ligase
MHLLTVTLWIEICSPTDPAYVIFTSGTTGKPKGTISKKRCLLDALLLLTSYLQFPISQSAQELPLTARPCS